MLETLLQEFEGQFGKGKSLQELVDWVEQLPPMPHVAAKAMNLVDDPNSTPEELGNLLNQDPALAAQLLKVSNSAMFAQQGAVTNLDQAILIIGFRSLKSLITAATLRQLNRNPGPMEQLVWEKSMGTAVACSLTARQLRKGYAEDMTLLGLLHNMGQFVLLSRPETAKEFPAVIDRIQQSQIDFAAAEREVIGFSHPLIGSLVAKKWNFPLQTCQVILLHANPLEGIENEQDEKIALVQLGTQLAMAAGLGVPPAYPLDLAHAKDLARVLKFPEPEQAVDDLIAAIKEKAAAGVQACAA